jgi:hypothetical protein
MYEFKLYGSNIEIVESYSYLGLTFTYNGKLTLVKKKLAEQAQKALCKSFALSDQIIVSSA